MISIIVAAYNEETDTPLFTIRILYHQKYGLRIIVVNDGSTETRAGLMINPQFPIRVIARYNMEGYAWEGVLSSKGDFVFWQMRLSSLWELLNYCIDS